MVDYNNGVYTGWSTNSVYHGPPPFSGVADKNFVFTWNTPASVITVNHNLQKYPSVTVVNSANDVVIGDIAYVSQNTVTITFTAPFSGTVYCN